MTDFKEICLCLNNRDGWVLYNFKFQNCWIIFTLKFGHFLRFLIFCISQKISWEGEILLTFSDCKDNENISICLQKKCSRIFWGDLCKFYYTMRSCSIFCLILLMQWYLVLKSSNPGATFCKTVYQRVIQFLSWYFLTIQKQCITWDINITINHLICLLFWLTRWFLDIVKYIMIGFVFN